MRLPLLGGAYTALGLIASAQRSVNIYPEFNPQRSQAPVNVTHYVRPGRTPFGAPPVGGAGRCLYGATNGDLYAVVDQSVYYVDPNGTFTLLGQLVAAAGTPVYMADNGIDILLVDGSPQGYQILLANRTLTQIGDPNFLGSDRVDFLDSFMILNEPGTPNWYSSLSNQIAFNALDFGSKTAWPDNIIAIIAVERQVWLLGPKKGEIWFNAGTSPFSFQILPGNIIEQGCAAKYSLCKMDINVYWISQSPEGARMAVKGAQNTAQRISTHAIEQEWQTYPRIDDAIGSTFLINGHAFVKFDFPSANKSWVYDEATQGQWHEEAYNDQNGGLNRMRDSFTAYAYGKNLCQDFSTGQVYIIDPTNFTDNNQSIRCIRSFPHVVADNDQRMTFWELIADLECGTSPNSFNVPITTSPWGLGFSNGFGPQALLDPPEVSFRWSLDRGFSYTNPVIQPMGASGQYNTNPTWRRLGYGFDFVGELSWSTPMRTALQGVFLEIEDHEE